MDASLLVLPQVGFCAADDPRMLATVGRLEKQLMTGGLLNRYRNESGVDGLAGTEHPFLACSFWLVGQYAATGRVADAEALMDRACGALPACRRPSTSYSSDRRPRSLATPQAFSHLALVGAADALAAAHPAGSSRGQAGRESS